MMVCLISLSPSPRQSDGDLQEVQQGSVFPDRHHGEHEGRHRASEQRRLRRHRQRSGDGERAVGVHAGHLQRPRQESPVAARENKKNTVWHEVQLRYEKVMNSASLWLDFGPIIKSTDPKVFKSVLSSLSTSGGGDKEELSLSALQVTENLLKI